MSEGKEIQSAQDKNEEGAEAPVNFERDRSPNFISCYSNNVEIGFSAWDMRLVFSEIVGAKDNKVIAEEHARVVMSLQHAKVFAVTLAQQIEQLERRFGEIQLLTEKAPEPSNQEKDKATA